MATPRQTVQDFIAAFVAAWPSGDAAAVASFLAEDAVYHNIPLEPVVGREAIRSEVARFMAMGGTVSVDVSHVVADGAVVMVERVDHFAAGDRTITLPMVGVFEVAEDRITAWRDYFDLSQLAGPDR